jgi:hypothetical protein
VTAYLNTRGRERHRDYQFIGPAPPSSWWRAYSDHTTFERPTVLAQSDGHSWQVYLSGIPSGRRDAVGTVIRYTVVAAGGADLPSPAPPAEALSTGDILALVANWLADQDRDRAAGDVSDALDAAFPEPDVERLLAVETGEPTTAAAVEVQRRLAGALHALRLRAATESTPPPDAWLADLSHPPARSAFVQQVDALLTGQPGRALVLNLVGAPDDLAGLVDDPRPLAVLAPELPDPAAIVALNRPSGEPAKKAAPPPGTTAPEPATVSRPTSSPPLSTTARNLRGCLRLVLIPIALIVAMALALLGTLFYLR